MQSPPPSTGQWRMTPQTHKMSMVDSEGLTTGDIMDGFGANDRNMLGQWIKQPRQINNNMTTIVIVGVVLVAIIVIFLGCYFLLRFIHRALGSDGRKYSNNSPYSNVVIHSKRVYEIQAEEGCFTGPPDINDPGEEAASKSTTSEDRRSLNGSVDGGSVGSLKKPETGDLKTIRMEHDYEDPRQMMRRKEKKVHKDSVCALLFKPGTEPRMV
uniref:4.1m domain-containing protein n=1 Tax=Haemonchus contortus TaxID=6289 RepID=A0A7I5ECJ4_HAECO